MKNKNLPLIVGIAIPFVFLLIFAGFVYIPKMSINPEYDFVYTMTRNEYDYVTLNEYSVINGSIEIVVNDKIVGTPVVYEETPDLYIYDVKNNTTNLISYEEASELDLHPGPSSPDGYIVDYKYGNNGIFELFGNNSDNRGYYIGDENGWKKLPGLPNDYYYGYRRFKLIGWIK